MSGAAPATRRPAGLSRRVELDVWFFRLDFPPPAVDRLRSILSDKELEHASRFRFRRDTERFVAGRGQMRRILARCVGSEPARLSFDHGPAGKPRLSRYPGMGFNLAHSGDLALLAVAPGAAVGVDIERDEAPSDAEEFAPMYFASDEIRELAAMPAYRRGRAFLRCWTRKEAYVKALGDGLQVPLADFCVSMEEDEARLRWCRRPGELDRWEMADLSHLVEGAIAAVCVEGRIASIRSHREPPW